MKMSKSRFKTKLSKKQKRNNIIVFFAVFVFFYLVTLLFSVYAIEVFNDWSDLEEYLWILAFTFIFPSMLIIPVIIAGVVLGVQKGNARRVRDDSTFVRVRNIDYYRESLSELSPALVSILIDLDIYGKKDIVATMLRMQNKGAISFNSKGKAKMIKETLQSLDDSELELLNLLINAKMNDRRAIATWKQNRFNDAVKLGYINKKAKVSNAPKGISVVIGLLSFTAGFVLWGFFLNLDFYNVNNFFALFGVIIFLLVIDAAFFLPIYFLIRWSVYNKRFIITGWERTELGNEMAEKIAGLARFINEFSTLSEAEKEQVKLWDDYLVYAIVLEENEKIVKDICRLYKINLRSFEKLHSIIDFFKNRLNNITTDYRLLKHTDDCNKINNPIEFIIPQDEINNERATDILQQEYETKCKKPDKLTSWKDKIAIHYSVQEELQRHDRMLLWEYHNPELPATEEQIAAAEAHLGHKIDKYYRDYLLCSNGWKWFSGSASLFGTEYLMGSDLMNEALEGLDVMDDVYSFSKDGFPKEELLPIAISSGDRALHVMTRPESKQPGVVILYDSDEVDRYPNFEEYFLDMTEYNRSYIDWMKDISNHRAVQEVRAGYRMWNTGTVKLKSYDEMGISNLQNCVNILQSEKHKYPEILEEFNSKIKEIEEYIDEKITEYNKHNA